MSRVTARRRLDHVRLAPEGPRTVGRRDTLAVEEPLEIRCAGNALAVTMRTPGDDFDLATGFLVTEGVVRHRADIAAIRYCAGATEDGANTYNVLDVSLAPHVAPPAASVQRNFYTTSSCGVCGKAALDAVRTQSAWPVADDGTVVDPATLTRLPGTLRAAQEVFDRTGGLHAAGLFTAAGRLLCLREDIGRHNAVDKVVGWAAREDLLPLRGAVLVVSGRASFELAQKALMAGVPVLAAVSAPSSLAVELADDAGMTLVGFLRGPSMNVYTGPQRVRTPVSETCPAR